MQHKPSKRTALTIGTIALLLGTLAEVGIAQSVLLSTVLVVLYYAVVWVNGH